MDAVHSVVLHQLGHALHHIVCGFRDSRVQEMCIRDRRTNMHIDKDSKLEIFVEGDQIILKKHRPAGSCDFCGELAADMAQYEGYCICPACRAKIAAL